MPYTYQKMIRIIGMSLFFWLDLSLVQFVLAGFSAQKSTLLVAISISYNRSSVTNKEALSKDDVELAMSGVCPKAYCEN